MRTTIPSKDGKRAGDLLDRDLTAVATYRGRGASRIRLARIDHPSLQSCIHGDHGRVLSGFCLCDTQPTFTRSGERLLWNVIFFSTTERLPMYSTALQTVAADKGPSLGDTVLAISTVAGAVLALIGLYALAPSLPWTRAYKKRRAEETYFESLLNASEAAERKLQVDRLRDLQVAMEEELPNRARQLFLQHRREDLIATIGSAVGEFERINEEYEKLTNSSLKSVTWKPILQEQILPEFTRRRSQERRVQILAILTFILLILPYQFTPSQGGREYFDVTFNFQDYEPGALVIATIVLAVVLGLVWLGVNYFLRLSASWKARLGSRWMRWGGITLAALTAIGCAIAAWNLVDINYDPYGYDYYDDDNLATVADQIGWLVLVTSLALSVVFASFLTVVINLIRRRREESSARLRPVATPSAAE